MKTHLNRHDLVLLAIYLNSLPVDYAHFDMTKFYSAKITEEVKLTFGTDVYCATLIKPRALYEGSCFVGQCGTAACAIGHGPSVKGTRVQPVWDENYIEYSQRFLTSGKIDVKQYWSSLHEDMWTYLFSDEWESVDNTPHGAAKRIMHLVRHTDDTIQEFLSSNEFLRDYEDANIGLHDDYTNHYINESIPASLEEFVAEFGEV